MILLFARLARTYSKNGGIATGGGILNPVLFIRDEIAIPNIEKSIIRNT
jgi:F-type H+-transporting ATPase subunit a